MKTGTGSIFINRLWRVLRALLAALVLLVAFAFAYDAYASSRVPADYPAPGQFVQIGQAKMHYVCMGSGEPTLVLEAGIGGGALDWMPVMPLLAAHNRVCAFDRFGQDWSEPAPHPRDFGTAADELHAALQQLGIEDAVVVGHSLGGALVQVYAAKYGVRGVVLVEGLTSDVVDPVVRRLGSYQQLNLLAELGLLRPLGGMLSANPAYEPKLRAEMTALRSRSEALLATADEGAVALQSAGAEVRAAESRLTMPLLIIAAGNSDVPGLPVGAFAGAAKALAGRVPNATYVLIPGAKHYVQAEQPQAVADAIEAWLATLR
jgi:pimeloyl-ACP methyl ester carboxylesterase